MIVWLPLIFVIAPVMVIAIFTVPIFLVVVRFWRLGLVSTLVWLGRFVFIRLRFRVIIASAIVVVAITIVIIAATIVIVATSIMVVVVIRFWSWFS